MNIVPCNNQTHRTQLISLWQTVFGYTEARNRPERVIDKKLEVDDMLLVALKMAP